MSKEDRKILNQFSARVHQRFSDARVWAFGSRARGDATWDSDFDVFVILKCNCYHKKISESLARAHQEFGIK